jgi:ferric-dicitrate binding protein FerR (iron transport regulator)
MNTKQFTTSIERIQSGKAEASELVTIFRALLNRKLTTQQQHDICQVLAEQQHHYAVTAAPMLESWVATVTTALTHAGFAADRVREIEGRLTFGTYLHQEKYIAASDPGDAAALTVFLHIIFFNKTPEPAGKAAPRKNSPLVQIVVTLKTNFKWLLGGSLTTALLVTLLWFHIYPIKGSQKVCPPNAIAVHGKRFLPLPDGTEIILAEGSSLCYCHPFYSNGRREAGLQEGQAYFEIEPDAAHPFFIKTPGGVMAEIRGTGLNISVDQIQQIVSIAVAHGIVIVHYNGEITEVPPGQQMSIALLTHETRIENFDPSKVTWPYPRIDFENATLETIAKEIEERFHVSVVFKNESLKKAKITAHFQNDEIQLKHIISSLDIALRSMGIRLQLKGTTAKVWRESNKK